MIIGLWGIDAFAQPVSDPNEYDVPIGGYPQRNTAWKFAAEFLYGKYFGDVADATVSDASAFADKRLGWILANLHSRSVQQKPNEKNNLYAYQETFAQPRAEWSVAFPPGKRLQPGGVFLCFIGGLPFSGSARARKGYGLQDAGIQVVLNPGWLWPAGTDARMLYQLIDAGAWNPEAEIQETGEPATPKDAPSASFTQTINGF